MELTLFEKCRKKRMLVWFSVWLFAISAFYAAVCTPVYHVLNSDILISDTVFPLLWDTLMQILNYLFYWGAFAIVLYAIFRLGIKNCISFLGIYVGTVFFRYFSNLLAGFLTNGFPLMDRFLSDDLPYLILDIVLDLLLMGVFVWILIAVQRRNTTARNRKRGEFLLSNLPFVKLFDLKNPVQLAAFLGALIPSAVLLISRVIFDISYGAPTGIVDLLWMAVYYVSDIGSALIGFILAVLLVNRFYFSEEKARLDYETPLPNDPV